MQSRGMIYLLLLSLFWSGCASYTLLSVPDQEKLQNDHLKKTYHLKQSFFVGPFFEYGDRLYISERAFDERVLIQTPGGNPIFSCDPTGILPMGTRVILRGIEFPTGAAMALRKLKSPRHFTWVMLELEGKPHEKPYILVLTQEFKQVQDFENGLKEFLVSEDPRKELATLSSEELEAIDHKMVVKGMRVDALLRSRGYPDRITRKFVEGVKMEHWQYAPDRVVVLREDRVDSFAGFPSHHLKAIEDRETKPPSMPPSAHGS